MDWQLINLDMQLNNTDIHDGLSNQRPTLISTQTEELTSMHGTNNGWPLTAPKPPSPAALDNLGLKITYNTCQPSMRFALLPHPHALDVGTTSTMEGEKTARRLKPPTGTRSVSTPITVIPSGSTFRQKQQFAVCQRPRWTYRQPCVLTVNGTTLNPIGKITFWRPHLLVWGVCRA